MQTGKRRLLYGVGSAIRAPTLAIKDGGWLPGIDITPLLVKGQEMEHDRTLYWSDGKEDAIREADWKLHLTNGKVDGLFDLSRDPEKRQNLAAQETARVDTMLKLLRAWKDECVAAQPRRPRVKKPKQDREES
jgi:hypothetical protein